MVLILPSHYISFAAFIQLAVALNFGLVYLDRRSSLLGLKRKLFSTYRAGKAPVIANVANILRRYKGHQTYSYEVEHAHTKVKEYHAIVTSEWDDEHELSFFPSLGVIYGFYSLAILYLMCFFDMPDREYSFQNQFLTLSQLTLSFSIVLIVRSWFNGKTTKIVPTTLLYIIVAIAGWICTANDIVFQCDLKFYAHYHWYMLMAYLPVIYYVARILILFIMKTLNIVPMVWWAVKFNQSLDKEKQQG